MHLITDPSVDILGNIIGDIPGDMYPNTIPEDIHLFLHKIKSQTQNFNVQNKYII